MFFFSLLDTSEPMTCVLFLNCKDRPLNFHKSDFDVNSIKYHKPVDLESQIIKIFSDSNKQKIQYV